MHLSTGFGLPPKGSVSGGGGSTLEADVIAMFDGGVDGFFVDPSNNASVFQERTGLSATTPAAEDDSVGTFIPLAGTFDYFAAPTDGQRPLRKTIGGFQGLLWDGSDDCLERAISMAGATTFNWFCAVYAAASTQWILGTGNSNSQFVGAITDGSSSATHAGSGTPTSFVNNASIGAETRDNLHDNVTGSAWKIEEIKNITAGTGWNSVRLSGYSSVNWRRDMYSGPEIMLPSSVVDTGSNRQTILDYFTEKVGAP